MTSPAIPILILVLAYLIGSIPFGYLVARQRGVNIFEHGSGNIGATNVGRILGRRFGVLVFILDFAKGVVAVLTASVVREPAALGWPPDWLQVCAGLAAFLGHLFPIYLRFRGGKGVATAAGIAFVLLPVPMMIALMVWTALVSSFRMVGPASLSAAAFLCVWRLAQGRPFAWENVVLTAFCLLITGLVFVRHHANIKRLLQGKENQMRDSHVLTSLTKVIHVLALGLWFGMSVFFTFAVGTTLFDTFWRIGEAEAAQRPLWFPADRAFTRDPQSWRRVSDKVPFETAREVRREQGTRAAGAAVSPLLRIFFPVQGVCGLLALITGLGLSRREPSERIAGVRVWLLLAALGTVLAAWPLAVQVATLGFERDHKIDEVLRADEPNREMLEQATDAKQAFTRWHLASLGLSLLSVLLVSAAMALLPLSSTGRSENGASTSPAAAAAALQTSCPADKSPPSGLPST